MARIDTLPEKEIDPVAAMDQPGLAAIAPMLGKTRFETGIQVEWIAPDTADLRSTPYADWPELREDWERLPFKQRQRLAEHFLLHVESRPGDKTFVGYELQFPAWAMVAVGAGVALLAWLTWQAGVFQGTRTFQALSEQWGLNGGCMWRSIVFLWALALYAAAKLLRILKLQNTSLIDNLMSTFGPISPGGDKSD